MARKEIPSRGPSWPVFPLSLGFFYICYFCYFWGVCYSVFLGRKKNPCYFCAFNFAGFSGPFFTFSLSKSRFFLNLLFLELLWYLQVIVSQNFLVNHFFCKNCEKNLLANFCSKDRSWTYLSSYETLLILLELITCLTFFKKDARSF